MPNRRVRAISRTLAAAVIIVVLVVAGLAAYFVYYGAPSSKPSPLYLSGTLNVVAFSGYNDAAMRKIASDFMAAYPNVTVNLVLEPYGSSLTAYLTAFNANQSQFDVIGLGSSGFMGALAPYLLNLSPYLNNASYFPASWNSSDVIQSTMGLYELNGSNYGIPMIGGVVCFYYRPSLFNNVTNQQAFQQQFGYALPNPATTTLSLSQLTDVASFFNGNHGSKYGIVLPSDSGDDDIIGYYMVILSGSRVAANSTYGPVTSPYGVVMSSTGQFLINSSIGQSALNTYIKLVSNSEAPLSASFSTVPAYFAAGDAAMMLYSASPALYLNNASRSSIPNDWALAPHMPGGYSILGGVGIGVYKYSQNIPAAVAFVQFATSQNESTNFVSLNNLLPFRYSGFTYYGQINPTYSNALAALASTMAYSIQGYANTAYWPQVSSIFRSAFPDMYSGKVSVATGTNQVVAQIYSSIGS